MKLSDMSFDAMMKVVSTIAVELDSIFDDDKVMNITTNFTQIKDESALDYGRRVAKEILSILLLISEKYKPALCRIFAAYFQCNIDDIGKRSVKELVLQVQDSLNDEVLLGFFPQLKSFAQNEWLGISLNAAVDCPQKRHCFMFWKNSKKN